jgi:hypothetical protein
LDFSLPSDDEAEAWVRKTKPRTNPVIGHAFDPIRTEIRVRSGANTKTRQQI